MRKYVDWFQILNEINNPELMDRFFVLSRKLRKGKSMSKRRCAYNVLKDYYSTTTIDELLEKLGFDKPDSWCPLGKYWQDPKLGD